MRLPKFAIGALSACALLVFTSVASAYYPSNYFGGGYGNYGGFGAFGFGNRYANQPILPYYSQFPPVYYSRPVARPYGFSPYALPPGVLPAELAVRPQASAAVQPRMTSNPFMDDIEPIEPEGATAEQAAVRGAAGLQLGANQKLIENPYFKASPESDASAIAGQ